MRLGNRLWDGVERRVRVTVRRKAGVRLVQRVRGGVGGSGLSCGGGSMNTGAARTHEHDRQGLWCCTYLTSRGRVGLLEDVAGEIGRGEAYMAAAEAHPRARGGSRHSGRCMM